MRTYLDVPFSEKDQAKQLGARWDPPSKRWYVPPGLPLQPFERWLPDSSPMQMLAPIWLVESVSACWKCHGRTRVFCLACAGVQVDAEGTVEGGDDGEMVFVSDLSTIDPRIEPMLRASAPGYALDYSKTQDARVWMNHCARCGAKLGDFYLHEEPGGAFFPTTPEEERLLRFSELLVKGTFLFFGSYGLQG
jgi:hypothetical protein